MNTFTSHDCAHTPNNHDISHIAALSHKIHYETVVYARSYCYMRSRANPSPYATHRASLVARSRVRPACDRPRTTMNWRVPTASLQAPYSARRALQHGSQEQSRRFNQLRLGAQYSYGCVDHGYFKSLSLSPSVVRRTPGSALGSPASSILLHDHRALFRHYRGRDHQHPCEPPRGH
jgi:hypothetical protein